MIQQWAWTGNNRYLESRMAECTNPATQKQASLRHCHTDNDRGLMIGRFWRRRFGRRSIAHPVGSILPRLCKTYHGALKMRITAVRWTRTVSAISLFMRF